MTLKHPHDLFGEGNYGHQAADPTSPFDDDIPFDALSDQSTDPAGPQAASCADFQEQQLRSLYRIESHLIALRGSVEGHSGTIESHLVAVYGTVRSVASMMGRDLFRLASAAQALSDAATRASVVVPPQSVRAPSSSRLVAAVACACLLSGFFGWSLSSSAIKRAGALPILDSVALRYSNPLPTISNDFRPLPELSRIRGQANEVPVDARAPVASALQAPQGRANGR